MKRLGVCVLYIVLTYFFSQKTYAQVNASFTVDRYNICSGTSILMTNTSTGANRYEWKIDGLHYSYARDTSAVLTEDCYDLKEIKLFSEDSLSGIFDSASIVVEVFDTRYFHWTGTFFNCPGDTISLAVNPEEISTLFSIQASVNVLAGCLTCPSIQFILTQAGTIVDRTSTYAGGCSEVTSYEYFCTSTSIDEKQKNAILFSPNPVRDHLTVANAKSLAIEITIYDLGGKQLFTKNICDRVSYIDLSILSAGVYIIRSKDSQGYGRMQKIIKQ